MKNGLGALLPLTLLSAAIGACGDPDGDANRVGDDDVETPVAVHQFVTRSGGEGTFTQLEDGAVVIQTLESPDIAPGPDLESRDLAEVYRSLSGDDVVPSEILGMNAALQAHMDQAEPSASSDEVAFEMDSTDGHSQTASVVKKLEYKPNLTAAQFRTDYCWDGEWETCRLSRTGSYSYAQWGYGFRSWLYVYRDSAIHKMRRKRFGRYSSAVNPEGVVAGRLSTLVYIGWHDYIKIEVTDADGGYHHAAVRF